MYGWIGLIFNKEDEKNIKDICTGINKEYRLSESSFKILRKFDTSTISK